MYPDNDQLYHDGIELDRANEWSKSQDIAMAHRSIFTPNYDETRMKKGLPSKRLKSRSKNKKSKEHQKTVEEGKVEKTA